MRKIGYLGGMGMQSRQVALIEDQEDADLRHGGKGPGPETLPESKTARARQRRLRLLRYHEQVATGKPIRFVPWWADLPGVG